MQNPPLVGGSGAPDVYKAPSSSPTKVSPTTNLTGQKRPRQDEPRCPSCKISVDAAKLREHLKKCNKPLYKEIYHKRPIGTDPTQAREQKDYEDRLTEANDRLYNILTGSFESELGPGGCFHSQVVVKNEALKRYRENYKLMEKIFPVPSASGDNEKVSERNAAAASHQDVAVEKERMEKWGSALAKIAEAHTVNKLEAAIKSEDGVFSAFQSEYAEICTIREGAPPSNKPVIRVGQLIPPGER